MKYTLDRIKDVADKRDHLAPPPSIILPSNVDLRPWLGPVKDQGEVGSCTAHAGTGLREFLYRKLHQYEIDKSILTDDFRLSPLFLYAMERELEGTFGHDNGAQSRTIFVALTKYGCLLEKDDPYTVGNVEQMPTVLLMPKALPYSRISYHRILDVPTLKSVLASGYVATVGMPVFSSFQSDNTAATGLVTVPQSGESCDGGHEMLCVGYSDARKAVCVRNSWGAWGDDGNCWIPYDYFTSELVTAQGGCDFWTAHLGKPW